MTSTHEPLACPWCAHESANGDDFRTHLMVEHRKSVLAGYVLDRQHADAAETTDAQRRADPPADDEAARAEADDAELLVRR